ncbi:Membrane-bound alkaline phosphatase [Gryllus bimaculatus]|nr:Membrane-bound alkaline phosphatase [Gryllus bimaculatus]
MNVRSLSYLLVLLFRGEIQWSSFVHKRYIFLHLCFCSSVLACFHLSPNLGFVDRLMHAGASRQQRGGRSVARFPEEEKDAAFWRAGAQQRLRDARQRQPNTRRAKNLIMFLGDGMSIPTLAAARTYQGQLQGQPGEESQLFFETFPYAGLSKTYCVDAQVADSACSATAYLCGVKGNIATIGVTASVVESDCKASQDKSTHEAGKATGIVTTTRVTHASPAGAYAHTADRDWESDRDVIKDKLNPSDCPDIAQQLITGETGKNFKVSALGNTFLVSTQATTTKGVVLLWNGGQNLQKSCHDVLRKRQKCDSGRRAARVHPRGPGGRGGLPGKRKTPEPHRRWQKDKQARGARHQYVWNLDGLRSVDYKNNEYLLGLFESSHMMYHLDALQAPYNETEPTLTDMVRAAITTLQRHSEGFHHMSLVTVQSRSRAYEINLHIILTTFSSLHRHQIDIGQMTGATEPQKRSFFVTLNSVSINACGGRIDQGHHETWAHKALDETVQMAEAVRAAAELTDEQDTLIVVTADHAHTMSINGYPDRGNDIFEDKDYEYPALAPRSSETHGGDDVAVLSRGPWAHLLTGVFEQNYIAHVMAYAACIGSGATACEDAGAARRH